MDFLKGPLKLFIIIFFLFVNPVFAQQEKIVCNEKTALAWDMNTESDMDHYTVYSGNTANIAKGGVGVKEENVPHDPSTAITNPDGSKTVTYKFTVAGEGILFMAISASDTSGNESGLSNEINCLVNFAPGVPIIKLIFNLSP